MRQYLEILQKEYSQYKQHVIQETVTAQLSSVFSVFIDIHRQHRESRLSQSVGEHKAHTRDIILKLPWVGSAKRPHHANKIIRILINNQL